MPEQRRMRPLLGTFVEVGAWAPDEADVARAVDAAFASLAQSHARWSFHSADSELSLLNRGPGDKVALSGTTLRLLRAALAMTRASHGAFNCTVGGALVARGVLPDHGGPEPVPVGEADDVVLGSGWALLRRPVRITLDGIAKGFAVDLAVQTLRRCGATSGWVNAGGDLRVFGERSVPVQRRELDDSLTPLGQLRNAALASSRVGGALDERFPGCIVGAPANAPVEVLSVVARSAWRADALTKVAALTPPAERAARVAQLGGCLLAPTAWRQAA
ncbi:FAD:protein FMN transferase [Ideonella sp. BN130291]|uniref:FAD:protein FMN transferase n=1 Tax=Ideonella sp. BN130291 TaxID=3112940 RepID=UPI002E260736|nr:FAD:protein FMN transferase [Ideonella sp. BN130291]